MIVGIGHDIVDINRIRHALTQYKHKFALRLLSVEELAIFELKKDKSAYLAKRFAAKEALVKALGTGLRKPYYLNNITVLNDALGLPYFKLTIDINDLLAKREINRIHLSLSDERNFASAMVVLER